MSTREISNGLKNLGRKCWKMRWKRNIIYYNMMLKYASIREKSESPLIELEKLYLGNSFITISSIILESTYIWGVFYITQMSQRRDVVFPYYFYESMHLYTHFKEQSGTFSRWLFKFKTESCDFWTCWTQCWRSI